MNKVIFITVMELIIFSTSAFADKIYLKSGDVLDGKIRKEKDVFLDAWCAGEDKVLAAGECIASDEILKIEKEYKKPEGAALLAKEDSWGEAKSGYKTQLIPAMEEYKVGESMKFHLVVKSQEDKVKFYDSQGIIFNTLTIKNEEGREAYYKMSGFQSSSYWGGMPIDKGEINVLFENRDIEKEYVISEPGKYTIQFQGGNYALVGNQPFPPSNILEINVKPGTAKKEDILITALLKILPKRWQLTPGGSDSNHPLGRGPGEGFSVMIVRYPESGLKDDVVSLRLWQMKDQVELIDKEGKIKDEDSEFLGYNSSGYYYIHISKNAGDFWATVREDMILALNLAKK